jgi:hypothetical protein
MGTVGHVMMNRTLKLKVEKKEVDDKKQLKKLLLQSNLNYATYAQNCIIQL